jgi:hypothetical protein
VEQWTIHGPRHAHKNWPAEALEHAARRYVLELLHNPETMRRQVEREVHNEIAALRDPERKTKAWMDRLEEADRMRVAYQRQQAEGLMTVEELRARLGELDERRTEAEGELAALRDSRRRLDELRAYLDLIEEYLRELPYLVHGRDKVIRDYAYTEEHEERKRKAREEGRLPIFPISPEVFRERTPEEMQELREKQERERGQRYRAMYELLGLKVTASKDKTLEVRGTFGVRNVRLGSEPSATRNAVAGTDARDDPTSGVLAGGSPQFDAGGAYPDERYGEEEIVRYARQEEQRRGENPAH